MKLSSVEAILCALQKTQVRYIVVGGLAVAAHGHGRATFDIDLVVQLQPDNVMRAISALQVLGYRPTAPVPASQFADPKHRESWIRDKNYDRAMIGEILPDLPVHFVCLDTLVRMKEAVGRPKDLEDVRQLTLLSTDRRHD